MKEDSQVEKLYTKRASVYERLFINFLGWGKELKNFFQKSDYIHSDFKVLDAGCGTGIITRTLFHLAHKKDLVGLQFHAFDITQNMLEIFRQWISEQGVNQIETRQADVLETENLPSYWKEYDLIVSSTMLEYLPKDKIRYALVNLKQLLGVRGMLLIFITKRNIITQWLARKWWKTNLYEELEIRTLLYDAGFHTILFKKFSPGWGNSIMVIEAKI